MPGTRPMPFPVGLPCTPALEGTAMPRPRPIDFRRRRTVLALLPVALIAAAASAHPLLDAPFLAYQTNGGTPYHVAVADLDGDGHLDAVAPKFPYAAMAVFLGNGDATFTPAATYVTVWAPWDLELADVSGDGELDAIVFGFYDDMSVLLGNGDGTFGSNTDYPVTDPRSVAI